MGEEDVPRKGLGIAWAFTIAFIVVNAVLLLISVGTGFGAVRIMTVAELVFWFDMISGLIIGAYFGVGFIADFTRGKFSGKKGN